MLRSLQIVTFVGWALVGCSRNDPRLADHVSGYCSRLQQILGEIGSGRVPAAHVPGFQSWPAVYDRFVFCADARADRETADILATQFRRLVLEANETPERARAAATEMEAVMARLLRLDLRH